LEELLHSAEFRALTPSYSAKGADLMTYAVAVPGVGKVTTMDAVAQPVVLEQILTECNALMGRSSSARAPPKPALRTTKLDLAAEVVATLRAHVVLTSQIAPGRQVLGERV
jgi:hypothetical protein